jgi:uncharacterized protein YkwD
MESGKPAPQEAASRPSSHKEQQRSKNRKMAMKLRQIILASIVGVGMLTSVSANAGSNTPYEMELTRKINAYRQTKNLPPLHLSNTLNQLASEHSTYMNRYNQLSHKNFQQRHQRSGRNTCVENVGWNYSTGNKQFTPRSRGCGISWSILRPCKYPIPRAVNSEGVTNHAMVLL